MAGIKRWLQDKIGIGENRDKIAYLEKRIKLNQALIQQLMPERMPLNIENRNVPFFNAHRESGFNLAIHKNDLMFLSILLAHNGNIDSTLQEYFQVGFDTAQHLKNHTKGPVANLLDFGAGYGRVSRFLSSAFEGAQIFTSEIKPEAVRFNETVLGLNGISHGPEPESFKSTAAFDFIFAGSVFTHLPKDSAKAWLAALSTSLSETGTLVFSIHNAASFGVQTAQGFAFRTLSEDEFFSAVDDSISDNQQYGTAYFTLDLIRAWMTELGLKTEIQTNAFGGIQDLVIARK